MALQVWLPLDGDLKNYGVNGMTFSYINNNSALSINASGKIGKCYERTASAKNDLIRSSTTINLNNDISMCCWCYAIETIGDSANGLVTNHSHADNTGVGLTIKQVSASDYRISCNTGTGSGRTYCTYYGTTNIKNTWHHLALTYSKSEKKLQLWVDGKVEYTLNNYTNASKADYIDIFNWSTTHYTSANFRPKCRLNDVRIYDHCLSPKEVKEISKGLVLHYRLSGVGGENLARRTNEVIEATATSTSSTWSAANKYWTHGISIEANQTYTLSFDYEFDWSGVTASDHSGIGCGIGTGSSGSNYTADVYNIQAKFLEYGGSTDKGKFIYHLRARTDVSGNAAYFAFRLLRYDGYNYNGVKIKIWNFKLEKGDKATPWLPNPADTLYSTLGLNNNIEYDCSGYKHNGTKVGTIVCDSDTPRYSTSYDLSVLNSRITLSNIAYENMTYGTIGFWLKVPKEFNHWTHYLFLANGFNWTSLEYDFIIVANQGPLSSPATSTAINLDCCSYQYTLNAQADNWYHIAISWDRSTYKIKRYVNGVLVSTVDDSTNKRLDTYISKHNEHSIGSPYSSDSYSGNKLMSDLRIYSTALSDSDIKELYNSGAWVTQNAAAAYELREE